MSKLNKDAIANSIINMWDEIVNDKHDKIAQQTKMLNIEAKPRSQFNNAPGIYFNRPRIVI